MGVPKKHGTKSKTRKRRSHHALTRARIFACSECKAPKLPHRVCKNCGAYGNKKPR